MQFRGKISVNGLTIEDVVWRPADDPPLPASEALLSNRHLPFLFFIFCAETLGTEVLHASSTENLTDLGASLHIVLSVLVFIVLGVFTVNCHNLKVLIVSLLMHQVHYSIMISNAHGGGGGGEIVVPLASSPSSVYVMDTTKRGLIGGAWWSADGHSSHALLRSQSTTAVVLCAFHLVPIAFCLVSRFRPRHVRCKHFAIAVALVFDVLVSTSRTA